MNNVFVVTVYWKDYEWSRKDIVGVYTSENKAWEAKEVYEKDIERIKNLENPLTEEEQEMNLPNLPNDRFELWYHWYTIVDYMNYFSGIVIKEIGIDSNPKLYEDD